MRSYNRFFLFLSSCIPGCGELYLGYMKRGLSLLLISAGILVISSTFYLYSLHVFLAVVWLYSFFDSYNLYLNLLSEEAEPDAYLFKIPDLDSAMTGHRRLLGGCLIVFGGYMVYTSIMDGVSSIFGFWWEIEDLLTSYIPRAFISLLILILGVHFVREPKRKAPLEDSFIPPVSDVPPETGSKNEEPHQEP